MGRLADSSSKRVADEAALSTDQFGVRVALYWLILGCAMVATALVTLGMRHTLELWAFSAVALPAVFVGERLWYKFVRNAE
ncbi:MAG TPA: hypothetical protein VGM82_11570 [Gemmatimonadaceae bacterium]|jgi:hypothetical protein